MAKRKQIKEEKIPTRGDSRNVKLIGKWAFLVGIILALVIGIGFLADEKIWLGILILIGLIIGLLNITEKESMPFLISGLVLIIVSSQGKEAMTAIPVVNSILNALLAVFVPATIIVSIRNVFALARD